jgi:CrcB protein
MARGTHRSVLPERSAGVKHVAAVAAGGALGAPARYAISDAIHISPGTFPWTTFSINVAGSFVLGLVLLLLVERAPRQHAMRLFVTTGFLGAFTTFSTFAVDADVLAKDGHGGIAVVYVVATVAAGLAAGWAGIAIARRVR